MLQGRCAIQKNIYRYGCTVWGNQQAGYYATLGKGKDPTFPATLLVLVALNIQTYQHSPNDHIDSCFGLRGDPHFARFSTYISKNTERQWP